jgi:hypothetical protein
VVDFEADRVLKTCWRHHVGNVPTAAPLGWGAALSEEQK